MRPGFLVSRLSQSYQPLLPPRNAFPFSSLVVFALDLHRARVFELPSGPPSSIRSSERRRWRERIREGFAASCCHEIRVSCFYSFSVLSTIITSAKRISLLFAGSFCFGLSHAAVVKQSCVTVLLYFQRSKATVLLPVIILR